MEISVGSCHASAHVHVGIRPILDRYRGLHSVAGQYVRIRAVFACTSVLIYARSGQGIR